MDRPSTNPLHDHLAGQRAQAEQKRLQRHIVRDWRDDIISLIRDDGAKIDEVADAIAAKGEPVLRDGLAKEILAQIGTVKAIRSNAVRASVQSGPATLPVNSPSIRDPSSSSDLDEEFVGRRRRT